MPRERVLIVDDDEQLLSMMVFALQHYGFEVLDAGDGLTALEKIRTEPAISVLLTDLIMPGLSGHELIREARKVDPQIGVIVITAASTVEAAIKVMREGGAYDYLLKPLESMKLLAMACERAAAHRSLLLERKALQERVQGEAERLHALLASTGDAILAADAQGSVTLMNPAANKLLGLDDLVGCSALSCLPLSLASVVSDWLAMDAESPAGLEIPWLDGSTQLVSLTPIPEPAARGFGWVMVLRDITHLKNAEEYKAATLRQAVEKIQLPLVKAMNAMAELSRFSGAEARLNDIAYQLSDSWGAIKDWGDELVKMVEPGSAEAPLLTEIHLKSALAGLPAQLAELLERREMRLVIGEVPEAVRARADASLLSLLLEGLVRRAVMRSQAGCQVDLEVRSAADKVWIEISDDGSGVPGTAIPLKLGYSSFNLSRELASAGLELSLAKRLVNRMGGQIWLSQNNIAGSTIRVCLPAVPVSETSPSGPAG